jgi:superfamily II DNA/RNA helicase/cold shock CspA family protein
MSRSFDDLGVPADIVSSLAAHGIDAPFAIQTLTLADGCAGRDLCGRAPTGSGKTLAFGIPLAARIGRARPKHPRGLVLVPTRELAAQVCSELKWLGGSRKLRVAPVYGGAGFGAQLKALRTGVDVLVACPGRLTDLLERREVMLDEVEMVVLDEADRMADMGFLPSVKRLLDLTPASRQTLLFSATLDGAVDGLVRRYQRDPVKHMLPEDKTQASLAEHHFWRAERDQRVAICAEAIKSTGSTIVFCRTKHGADRLAKQLGQHGVTTEAIHGNRSQGQRERALNAFTNGKADALIATDVAARGIHIDDVACVVHFDLPNDFKDYTHRSGRTARAGAGGTVVSLVGRDQQRDAEAFQRSLKLSKGLASPDPKKLATPAAPTTTAPAPAVATKAARKAAAEVAPGPEPEPQPQPQPQPQPRVASGEDAPEGTVKWYDARKGFGFIERPGANDLFVHVSALERIREKRLEEGQRVEFELGEGRRGDEARRVRVLAS